MHLSRIFLKTKMAEQEEGMLEEGEIKEDISEEERIQQEINATRRIRMLNLWWRLRNKPVELTLLEK